MNILIVNLHSAKNLGDDAIMHTTLQLIQESFPLAYVAIAANDPESWRKYGDIEINPSVHHWFGDPKLGIYTKNYLSSTKTIVLHSLAALLYRFFRIRLYWGKPEQRRMLAAAYQADLVLSCGGGNFYANRSFSPSFLLHLSTLGWLLGIGKRVILLPQSFGPIKGSFQQRLTKIVFQSIDVVMAREMCSKQFLKNTLSLPRTSILSADLAFGLPPIQSSKENRWGDLPIKVGITVIHRTGQCSSFTGQEKYEAALVEAIQYLSHELQAEVHLFVQCYGPSPDQDDRIIAQKIFEISKNRGISIQIHSGYSDVLQLRNDMCEMDIMIGSRLHTGILAFGATVPVIMISYQPKSTGIMEMVGLKEYCVDIQDISGEVLISLIKKVVQNRKILRAQIAESYLQCHQQVKQISSLLMERSTSPSNLLQTSQSNDE